MPSLPGPVGGRCSIRKGLNFLRRGSRAAPGADGDEDRGGSATADGTDGTEAVDGGSTRSQTAAKGRPTPSRREAQGRRSGPVAPAPTTQREAFRRARQAGGSRQERRQAADERRARRRAGDDRVLPVRDRGPVRAHVRDVVDSRGHLLGLFAPLAVVGFVVALTAQRTVTGVGQLVALGVLAAMALEGILLGRVVAGRVCEKFPDDTTPGLSLGWYAATRAAQIRKLRVPSPRVARGDPVA